VPDGSFKYDTLQFAFNKRFGAGLFITGSYDYQWRDELRGTTPSTSPLNSDPLNVAFFLNPNPSVSNRQESTNWQGRAMARYVFKYDIGAAANLRAQSGFAYARIVSDVALPNAGTLRFYQEDIKNNRSDTVPILDFRVDKAFPLGRYKVSALFEIFNVTNSNAITNFVLTNGSYNRVIATLDPRTAQFGLRFDF
jgi:hypothetical protein